jgi:NAD(P)-dependent dehydrogenase (short-subunit alcohol dehydrogenase family)
MSENVQGRMKELAGQTAVIVGASSGIGLAAARALAAHGVRVIGVARNRERLLRAAGEAGFEPWEADTLDRGSLDRLFEGLPGLDHLVVTAYGTPPWGPLSQLAEVAMREAFDYKFMGYFRTVQAALPKLSRQGSITLVTGAVARFAMAGGSAPAAVNGALHAWAYTLAKELAPIRVNSVSPGLTATPAYDAMPAETREKMFQDAAARLPVGRIAQAEDVAAAIEFAVCSPVLTGTVLDVDGGVRLG